MLPIYVGALAFGGVLIVASVIFGGDGHDADHDADADADFDADADLDADADADLDADADADLDADADADVDVHAEVGHALAPVTSGQVAHDVAGGTLWLPFLSLRFWTFGLAFFGLSGVLFSVFGYSDVVSGPLSGVSGLGFGWAVAWGFRALRAKTVSGTVGTSHLRGREGMALLSVGPGKLGKVRLLVDGQDVDLPARTRDDQLIGVKQPVLVVEVVDGVAEVTSIPEKGRSKEEP